MRVLVTGADGFAGSWLVRRLLALGHAVTGTRRPGGTPAPVLTEDEASEVSWRPLELGDPDSVAAALAEPADAVVHLAALASGGEARRDPGLAWEVNAAGTARLAEALGAARGAGKGDPLLLLVSSAEVYGVGTGAPRREEDPLRPCSPYAASKVGAEVAAFEVARRTGLRLVVARPFPHTGPGQDQRFVVPALARRLLAARRAGERSLRAGDLSPVRDLLDVRDVVEAYLALLTGGRPGECYNIASGEGHRLRDLLHRLEARAGWEVTVEPDPALGRQADIPHLVGDAGRLRAATGWAPRIALDQTLADLLDAQAD